MISSIRWKCLCAFIFLAAELWSFTSRAAEVPTGAWKGSIGTSPIMVCFSESGGSQYYYLRHLRAIRLVPSNTDGDQSDSPETIAKYWQAGHFELDELAPAVDGSRSVSGHWLLQAKSPTEVIGTWTAPHNKNTLSISLTKAVSVSPVGLPDAPPECEQAYYEPILAAMHPTFAPATFAGHGYRIVSSDEAMSLEVPPELPHAQAFNRYAIAWLRSQSILAHDCDANLNDGGAEPIGRTLKPIVWTNQFVVLEDSLPEIFCGGAHGSWSLSYLTWSWAQGGPANTWAWLRDGEKSIAPHMTQEGEPIRSALFRLIVKHHPRNHANDNCREEFDSMSVGAPYPTAHGLVFNTGFPHAVRACEDQVTLEWKQLMPYLSTEGRAVANQFKQ